MSRIGKKIISLPDGVTITTDAGVCVVTGPKGSLRQSIPSGITITEVNGALQVTRATDDAQSRAYHGLVRTLLNNMITGVSTGYTKQLELQGVGYRAVLNGSNLALSLGYSHQITVICPEGISFKVEKNIISVQGIDKALVGEIAATIRDHRKPEPYKGKGIRYVGEYVRRKAGKAAKA